jgi:Uma2 family endonuclease
MTTLAHAPETPVASPPPEPEGHYEVVGTQVVEKPPMGAFEVGIASLLFAKLASFVEARGLGQVFSEMLFNLRPAVDRDRRPDLAFVSARQWPVNHRPPRIASWKIIPELAIEIISPTNSASEVVDKVREYLQAGVLLVWVVYPVSGEIHVHDARTPAVVRRLTAGDVLDAEPVLPGFQLDLATLFAPEEPA